MGKRKEGYRMVYDTSAIERAAAKGEELGDDLSLPDQLLFLSLRSLYAQWRSKIIDQEKAKSEKRRLLAEHELARFYYESYKATVELRNRVSSELVEIEKNGCDQCKRIVRLFDGREKQ